jgi:hypothetical protein
MTDPLNEPRNQPQVDTRANLFYFLQSISGHADDKGREPWSETPISNEQFETHQQQNRFML